MAANGCYSLRARMRIESLNYCGSVSRVTNFSCVSCQLGSHLGNPIPIPSQGETS